MAFVRSRGELGHIRPKLPSCTARLRPLLGASARPRVCAMALVRPCPSTWCSRTSYWKGRVPARAHLCTFWAPKRTARPRDDVSIKNSNPLSFSLILTSFSHFFSNPLNSKTHIFTHHHYYIDFVCETRLLRIAKCREGESKPPPMTPFPRGFEAHETRADEEMKDVVHERIVRLDGDEDRGFRERLLGLGWGFMYEDLVRINVSMVREFCANFCSAKQDHVFLRGKRTPFTEAHIRRYLGIPGEALDDDQDDNFVALVKAYERGDDMNMAEIYSVIGREETNWANDPANHTIPKSINNGILNPRTTAWHKIINANIDPKTHGTNFHI
ncbi:hypothetical protein PIB30_048996 [Stylosanthes scabra]|uniref:Putative plant transposon protein domain-containing protein n=1 Tax=Stylosanthes scabra TaxID=79078 RepID=A0ABU6YEK6_9FABA|nr:hypothetical protein [Stylosanthes scabra]